MNKCSKIQEELLSAIQFHIDEFGYAPSVRDLTYGCEISSVSVTEHHLLRLKAFGYIDFTPKTARSFRLTEDGEKYLITSAIEESRE